VKKRAVFMAHEIRKHETKVIAEPSKYYPLLLISGHEIRTTRNNAIQFGVHDKVFTSIFSHRNDIGSIRQPMSFMERNHSYWDCMGMEARVSRVKRPMDEQMDDPEEVNRTAIVSGYMPSSTDGGF